MSDATMNSLYQNTGFFWWLCDAGISLFEVFTYVLTFEFWQPDTWFGKVVKFPLATAGWVIALPGTIPLMSLAYAWFTGAV